MKSDGIQIDGRILAFARISLAAAFAFSLFMPAYLHAGKERTENLSLSVPGPADSATDLPAGVGSMGMENSRSELVPLELYYSTYRVEKGETIGAIADRWSLTQDTILSFNNIKNSRLLQIGQYLKLPNQDGLLYSWKASDTIEKVAERYEIDPASVRTVNFRIEGEPAAGDRIFLPAAKLARTDLQEINGDLLAWPIRGYVSSKYGYRTSPFTGARQFHSGLDIAAPYGTPVRTAMAGRVASTGYDVNSGNFVVITHHSGYRTFYGHLDVIRVNAGDYVKDGQRIGDVGSTGLSTGSHLHFTVFKNGVTMNPRNLLN